LGSSPTVALAPTPPTNPVPDGLTLFSVTGSPPPPSPLPVVMKLVDVEDVPTEAISSGLN
jgi:hypothetical protein